MPGWLRVAIRSLTCIVPAISCVSCQTLLAYRRYETPTSPDGAVLDGGVALDASAVPDAGDGAPAWPPASCAANFPGAVFCADFNDGALPGGWDEALGALGIRGPQSNRYVFMDLPAPGSACLSKSFDLLDAAMTFELDVRVPAIGRESLDLLVLATAARTATIGLELQNPGTLWVDNDHGYPVEQRIVPTLGSLADAWAHVRFKLETGVDGVLRVQVHVNDDAVATVDAWETPLGGPDKLRVEVGECYSEIASGWQLEIDNFVMTVP